MYRPPIARKADYLYEVWYDSIDYAYAYQWFRSHTPTVAGACSVARSGNLIGRNLDWTYDNSAEFIVHTDGVVGVANAIPGLTDEFVKSGADSELYKIVPFMLSDGINKHGLTVSTLVVPTDKGDNSVVQMSSDIEAELCTLMLPRFVLDKFADAFSVCLWLEMFARVYHPKTLQDMHYDQHFVIADRNGTYCLEFVDGEYNIVDISHKPFVTNFHLTGVEFNADGSVNTPARGKASDNKITPNGSGLERYNLINERPRSGVFSLLSEFGTMSQLMKDLAYTRAYQSSPNPAVPRWDTEFVGNGRTVDTPSSGYDAVQAIAANEYLSRDRNTGTTWQTVHSAVYDIQNKTLKIHVQEQFDTQWEVSVMARNTPAPIQQFRGTAVKLDDYTGPAGELTVDTTDKTLRVQDNARQGGHPIINTTTAQAINAEKTFTVSPLVPTQTKGDSSTKAASTAFVDAAVADIDIDTFPQTSKDNLGSAQIGYGLSVTEQGVVHVGMISRPSVIAPVSGADVFKSGSLTVETSPFSTQFASDIHVSTDYLVTTGSDRSGVALQAIGSTDKTSHVFADLSSLNEGETYYIHVRHNGANSSSAWSEPVNVVVRAGQVFAGRTVYRHSTLPGSVIEYDEFGVTKNLFVADAAYRGTAQWKTSQTAVSGLKQWNHYYYPTCTGNVIDSSTGYVDLSQVADFTPYSAQLSDAHFQAALTATLASVIQTAKAATDLMIADGKCPAATFVRGKTSAVGIEMQLPNIYQLLVMYACGDIIDSLDPTVAANPTFALGKYGTNTYRWRLGGDYYTCSSTEYSATNACHMGYGGHTYYSYKTNTRGVAPVAEL